MEILDSVTSELQFLPLFLQILPHSRLPFPQPSTIVGKAHTNQAGQQTTMGLLSLVISYLVHLLANIIIH